MRAMRMRLGVGLATAVAAGLASGITLAQVASPTQADPNSPLGGVSIACSTVERAVAEGVADLDVIADRESGLMRVEFSSADTGATSIMTIDHENDVSCDRSPVLNQIIEKHHEDMEEVDAQECESVRDILASGASEVDGREIDRAALQQYMTELCS